MCALGRWVAELGGVGVAQGAAEVARAELGTRLTALEGQLAAAAQVHTREKEELAHARDEAVAARQEALDVMEENLKARTEAEAAAERAKALAAEAWGEAKASMEESRRAQQAAISQECHRAEAAAAAAEQLEASRVAMRNALKQAMDAELNEAKAALQQELVQLAARAERELDKGMSAANRISCQAKREQEAAEKATAEARARCAQLEDAMRRGQQRSEPPVPVSAPD